MELNYFEIMFRLVLSTALLWKVFLLLIHPDILLQPGHFLVICFLPFQPQQQRGEQPQLAPVLACKAFSVTLSWESNYREHHALAGEKRKVLQSF